MVTITKGKTLTKKFITLEKAKLWIETEQSLKMINKGAKKVKGELSSIGLANPLW